MPYDSTREVNLKFCQAIFIYVTANGYSLNETYIKQFISGISENFILKYSQ